MKPIILGVVLTLTLAPLVSCDKLSGNKDQAEEMEDAAEKLQEMEQKLEQLQKRQAQQQAAPQRSAPVAQAPSAPQANTGGYVKLYDDKGFTDRVLTVPFGRNIGNMHYVNSDDGKAGFNDKASAAKYSVPAGWKAVLYENDNYAKRSFVLTGTGSNPDFGYFNDKCSSIRWERQ